MAYYEMPENPVYDESIRRLENTDRACAEDVFNPLFQKLINNTHAVKRLAEKGVSGSDTRNDDSPPSYYRDMKLKGGIVPELKECAEIGLDGMGGLCALHTIAQYDEETGTGGTIKQIAYTDQGTFIRQSIDENTWGDWTRVLTSADSFTPLTNGQAISTGVAHGVWQERYLGYKASAHSVANQKFDIVFPASYVIGGWIEVDLAGPYRTIDSRGRLMRQISCNIQANGNILSQNAKNIYADENVSNMLAVSDLRTNNSNCFITVAFRTSSMAGAYVYLRAYGSGDDISMVSLSEIYTTDATVFPKPVSYFAGDNGTWYDLVLQNGFTAHGTYPPKYRKIGNMVYMKGIVNGVASTNSVLGSLPAGFRPGYETPFAGMAASAQRSQSAWINVAYNGSIALVAPVVDASFAGAANSWFLDTSFIAEN